MEILSRSHEKLIRSLKQKKYRKQEGLFVVEGKKLVNEALKSDFEIKMVVFIQKTENELEVNAKTFFTDEIKMKQLSSLTTSPGIMAVIKQKEEKPLEEEDLIVVLEKIQDPGNLGTIIRTTEAFGVKTIVCSKDTVDHLSPKVIQATMGAIFRVDLYYLDLLPFLKEKKENVSIYGTHLKGNNIFDQKLNKPCVIVMGNESKGISEELMKVIPHKIKIPIEGKAESFNVSIANAIVLSEFKRQFSAF